MASRSLRTLLAATMAVVLGVASFLFLTERPLNVPVAVVENEVAVRVYGLGSVEDRILSKIGFEVGAALTELTVDNGDMVLQGQVMARINSAEQEARMARARAAVAAVRASLRKAETNAIRAKEVMAQRLASNARRQELAGRSVVSAQAAEEAQRDADVATAELAVAQSEIDVVKAQYADAKAALLYEETLLDHHVLRAPFDAVIVDRHVETGTVIRAGEVIFTIMDPATIRTLAYIDEERAGFLEIGQLAEVRLRSQPRQVFQRNAARIGIESDRANEERRVWLTCRRTECLHLGSHP